MPLHPSVQRIMHLWTRREEERVGATALEAEADLQAALREISAVALYSTIQAHAHKCDHPYAEAMVNAASYIRKHGIPPRWAIK